MHACSVAQLFLTLYDPMDCSPPGSSVPWISQARILQWVAISPFRGSSWPGTELVSPELAGGFFTTEPPGKPICIHESESKVAQSCPTLCDPMDWLYPTRLLHPWDFPGKNTGVGFHFLLQAIFPTQGLNPGLPHCRQTLYRLSHQGSPFSFIDMPKYMIIFKMVMG